MKIISLSILLVLLTVSCRKEYDILTGPVIGKIKLLEENNKESIEKSGVLVSLLRDLEIVDTALTDSRGRYRFENVAYGKYKLDLQKPGYIKSNFPVEYIYHVGGYSPTFADRSIYKIPSFEIEVDSVTVKSSLYEINFFVKINGDYNQESYYSIVGLFSNSPDISLENCFTKAFGYLYTKKFQVNNSTILLPYIYMTSFYGSFGLLEPGTIYIILYPAFGQSPYYIIPPEALGKPSNVFGFTWSLKK